MKREGEGDAEGKLRTPQVTERDRQLLAHLAICRYLSTEQLLRLFFPGRDKASSQRRLIRLAGEWGRVRGGRVNGGYANFDPPLLRRLFYRTFEGERVEVWAPSEVGYAIASKVLGVPQKVPAFDVGAAFLEHSILLNDVFVAAIDPLSKPCARCGGALQWRPKRGSRRDEFMLHCSGRNGAVCHGTEPCHLPLAQELSFRWTGPEGARLPWRDYDIKTGLSRDRVIVPDAVAELPNRKRRLFVEFETGSHTLLASSDRKPGATSAKVGRYAMFFLGNAGREQRVTNYQKHYPDGWRATVIFVLTGEGRRSSVKNLLSTELRKHEDGLDMRAMLAEEVARYIRGEQPVVPAKAPAAQVVQAPHGRISVRAEYAIRVAACLERLVGKSTPVGEVSAASRKLYGQLLQMSQIYAQRAAEAKARA